VATTLLLDRHGETDWNQALRWQGHADRPLNERGRRQARALAEALAGEPPSAVYSSDLLRARETAQIVASRLGLAVVTVPELREVDVGSWSGLTRQEIEQRFPDGYRRWRAHEGHGWDDGESYEAMGERVVAALRRIAADHVGGDVLVVTHGGPIRAAVAHARRLPPGEHRRAQAIVENCGVSRIVVDDGALLPAPASDAAAEAVS
jgi:broad specificity phosphatase PhoE